MSTLNAKIRILANTSANLTAANDTLETGRFAYETDSGKLKIGTGANYNATAYLTTPQDVVWNIYKPGRMTTNETLARVLITSVTACNLTTAATGTGANATTAANATTVIELRKNGSAVGNFTWSASATTANVTIPANFSLAANDIFDLTLSGAGDATLANVSFTIAGKQ